MGPTEDSCLFGDAAARACTGASKKSSRLDPTGAVKAVILVSSIARTRSRCYRAGSLGIIGKMQYPVYEFFRDQGSIIAGVLALAAGIIAYIGAIKAANRQVAVLKDQIEDARTERR